MSDCMSIKFISTFLSGFASSLKQHIDIYMQNLQKCQYLSTSFCFPVIVGIKQENLIVYRVSFTQCICTGYCASLIFPLPSFIVNSWLQSLQTYLWLLKWDICIEDVLLHSWSDTTSGRGTSWKVHKLTFYQLPHKLKYCKSIMLLLYIIRK